VNRCSDKMKGKEESKDAIDIEPDFEGIEEKTKDIVMPSLNEPALDDILYHPYPPRGFFTCLAEFLRDVFYFLCFGSSSADTEMLPTRLKTRLQRQEMNRNDITEKTSTEPLCAMRGFDVYTRQDVYACQPPRLKTPAKMMFRNEKLIGPPLAEEGDGVGHSRFQLQSTISFRRPDKTPFSNHNATEPIRHILLLHRNRKTESVQSPIPIATEEALCRYDELNINDETNETVLDKAIKYEDIVKESNNMGLFGWLKPTNVLPTFDNDINEE